MIQNKSRKAQSQKKQQTTGPASGATASAEREVDVLYQRIGGRWFAFSVIDDEVYMGSISDDSVTPDHNRPFLNEIK